MSKMVSPGVARLDRLGSFYCFEALILLENIRITESFVLIWTKNFAAIDAGATTKAPPGL
jgi:hypothetical protein